MRCTMAWVLQINMLIVNYLPLEKAKPDVNQGRKTNGSHWETAGLPWDNNQGERLMKKFTKALVLSVLGCFLVAGSAMAVPFNSEYALLSGDFVGNPGYTAGVDNGYYLWADDEGLTSWHLRWSGDKNAGTGSDGRNYDGTITFDPNTVDLTLVTFESHTSLRDSLTVYSETDPNGLGVDYGPKPTTTHFAGVTKISFNAFADTKDDGFDFYFESGFDLPSYIAFNLEMSGVATGYAPIHVGAGNLMPEEDFYLAAPVPEPATFALLGLGLLGLAGISRRKMS